MGETSTPVVSDSLEHRLGQSAERVRITLERLIKELPVSMPKPAEFQRVLKLDRSLSSRLLRAVQLQDPLASLHRLPGPHGIRLLFKAATDCIGHHQATADAEEALVELEHLVVTEVGDWKELNSALSGWLPDLREQSELASRQSAFKAMSNIRGIAADLELSVTLIHPGRDTLDWVDRACITGLCGMKRLRPGAPMGLLHGHSIMPPPGTQRLSLKGEPIDHAHGPGLLQEFSTSPTPRFEVLVEGQTVHYLLEGDGVGLDSRVDLLFADVTRRRYPAHRGASSQPASPGAVIDVPVKLLIADVLVHEDVWQGVEPELHVYDTAARGLANPDDPARKLDRRDVLESIQRLGNQLSRFRTKEIAKYQEMVRFVCDQLGWDSSRFRGFRCRVEWPVYGYQTVMVFQPPSLSLACQSQ